MEWSLFEHVLASLKADGIKTVCFVAAQGEPMLHPRILDMLALALDKGFETNLCTNGTPLTDKRIAALAAIEPHSVQFSFAGWDKESYERAYVGGKFERVSTSLRHLIWSLRPKRTVLSINGVLDDPDDFERTRDYLHTLGARDSEIRLQMAHNWGGTVKTAFEPKGAPKLCPLLVSTPGIYSDGRVTACGCIDANGALEIGHIRHHRLSEMREGKPYQSMLKAFADGDISGLPLCATCEVPWLT